MQLMVGGHLSAAKSIKQYIDENYSDVETQIVDCVKYINKALDKLTTGAYREMAKKMPLLWGKVYSDSQKGILSDISKNTNKVMAIKLKKLINEIKPDLIISTHPFSSQMTSYLKRKGKIDCEIATILTDFAIHEQWTIEHENINYFFVSNDDMKNDLIKCGVDSSKIYVTGIALSNRFFESFDKEKIYENFNLDKNKKLILFFGGGEFGLGKEKTVKILESLINDVPEYQIVAIAGKNEKMKLAFEEIVNKLNANNRVRVLPFTDKVPELMSISNVVVTKPGGLTTTESLAMELPIIVINPIPGQEEENANFLVNKNVAVWIKKKDNPDEIILKLFSSPEKLKSMKNSTRILAKKNSTKDICDILLQKRES